MSNNIICVRLAYNVGTCERAHLSLLLKAIVTGSRINHTAVHTHLLSIRFESTNLSTKSIKISSQV